MLHLLQKIILGIFCPGGLLVFVLQDLIISIFFQRCSGKMVGIMYFGEIDMNWQSWKAPHSHTYYSHESWQWWWWWLWLPWQLHTWPWSVGQRQKTKRLSSFNILMSGQFCTLAMFYSVDEISPNVMSECLTKSTESDFSSCCWKLWGFSNSNCQWLIGQASCLFIFSP